MQANQIESELIDVGQWQWQSNQNPWDGSENEEWTSYSSKHNYLLEKAYYDQQKEVRLDDEYTVSIQDGIQTEKSDSKRQRKVRRIDKLNNIEMNERWERYTKTESPKTLNDIFGDLGDYINYFSRKNDEMREFTKKFQEIEKQNDLARLNEEILPKLVSCLNQEFDIIRKREKVSKITERKIAKLMELFQNVSTFKEFYEKIVKAYTLPTFLYERFNQYLRNETWSEMNHLSPYAFFICQVFFKLKEASKPVENPQIDNLKQPEKKVLFRGTAFDEKLLEEYRAKINQRFSWNSVTSTTTNKEIAEKFMYESANPQNKNYPVMFMIEVPENLANKAEYCEYLDIKLYSAKQTEDEIILPPGSVLEIIKISMDENQVSVIEMKLISNLKILAHKGVIMPFSMQKAMMADNQLKVMCLDGLDLLKVLHLIRGNNTIQEIEFCLCKFNKDSLKEIIKLLPTLEKLQKLRIVACSFLGEEEDFENLFKSKNPLFHKKSPKELTINVIGPSKYLNNKLNNFYVKLIRYLADLTSLSLIFPEFSEISDEGLNYLSSQGLQHLSKLTSLTLDLSYCKEITEKGVNYFSSDGLKNLKMLASLNLNFTECESINDELVRSLCSQGLNSLTKLTSLGLNFDGCRDISDLGLESLCSEVLQNLSQLISLNLNFAECSEITDQGMQTLCEKGIQNLKKLNALSLGFASCSQITNQGMQTLSEKVIQNFKDLNSLSLDFTYCSDITDEGIYALCSQIKKLDQLKSLQLYFTYCDKITFKQVRELCSQEFLCLSSLNSLNLDFYGCFEIQKEEVQSLNFQGFQSLAYLKLNLPLCAGSKEYFETLRYQVLNNTYIATFDLNFERRRNVLPKTNYDDMDNISEPEPAPFILESHRNLKTSAIDFHEIKIPYSPESQEENLKTLESIKHLGNKIMISMNKHLPVFHSLLKEDQLHSFHETTVPKDLKPDYNLEQLMSFSLDLSSTQFRFQEKLINNLWGYLLKDLTSLQSLDLNFSNTMRTRWRVKDEAINIFCSKGLKYLTCLKSLKLDFSLCKDLTNQGINYLCSEGLQFLVNLTSLNLNFSQCSEITNQGLSDLYSTGLRSFPELKHLSLDFSYCKVTQLETFGQQGFQKLISLNLNFGNCSKITEERFLNFCSQTIQSPSQLISLNLNFQSCAAITDTGFMSFCFKILQKLTSLKSLQLNFSQCSKITDEGLKALCSQGVLCTLQLTKLDLDFEYCQEITSVGFKQLCLDILKHLNKLKSLRLAFSHCSEITDDGICHLGFQLSKYKTQLTCLDLNFSSCPLITDEGFKYLCSHGFENASHLKSLNLHFSSCAKITNESFVLLCSKVLRSLANLRSLHLYFSDCSNITDDGVDSLCFEALKKLAQLESLCFDFEGCEVTRFTQDNIFRILKYFGFNSERLGPNHEKIERVVPEMICSFSLLPLKLSS